MSVLRGESLPPDTSKPRYNTAVRFHRRLRDLVFRMASQFRPIDVLLPRASSAYGGKAESLATLARAGFPLPRTFALSAQAAVDHYRQALPPALQPEALFAARVASEAQLTEARQRVLETPVSTMVTDGVRRVLSDMRRYGQVSMAVRSSSTLEDLPIQAGAGLYDTMLAVQGEEAVLGAIQQVWASLFQPLVLRYLQRAGARTVHGVGVVLQGMVRADVSGVLFTVNPLTADSAEMVLNAAYGLGTVVTDGSVGPDTYRITKDTGWVRDRVVGSKAFRDDWSDGTGVLRTRVGPQQASRMCLDEHLLGQLVDLGRRIERHFGSPRDIEWSVAGDRLFILQARPVTALPTSGARPSRAPRANVAAADPVDTVWSNINVGEALPGVATPLTWSILSEFSELGFRSAFAGLGCRVPKHVQLVGNFRGRIYLNLTELSRIAAQVPGLRPSHVLPFGGGDEIASLERSTAPISSLAFLSRLPTTAARLAREHLGLQRRVERSQRQFDAELARLRAMDLRILPGAALDATLSDVHHLLSEVGTLMLTAYGGLLVSLLPLRSGLKAALGDEAERWQQDLLSALEHVESADPGTALLDVAQVLRGDAAAAAVLVSAPTPSDAEALPPGPGRDAVLAFLRRFGHRAVREAELAEPRWRERPQLLFDSLRLYLQVSPSELPPAARARARLAKAEARLGEVREPLRSSVRALLRVSRHYMRLRERLRGRVTVVLDLMRWVALDASRRISVREPECGAEAAFFLTLPELRAFLRGEAVSLAAAVARRRAQYLRDQALPAPPDTFVGYPRPAEPGTPTDQWVGLAASGGRIEGRACVMGDPSQVADLQPGDIIVVASADVGWTPLFLSAAGLVTDAGGPLSHACVVAREYGLPAVVNLKNATDIIRTGDRLLLDGDLGTVTVL